MHVCVFIYADEFEIMIVPHLGRVGQLEEEHSVLPSIQRKVVNVGNKMA